MSHHQLLHEAHASGISFHGGRKADRNGVQDANILLQLQKVKVGKHGGGLAQLNVLWDGGSTLSFITFLQARQLKLIGEKVRIEIVKVRIVPLQCHVGGQGRITHQCHCVTN